VNNNDSVAELKMTEESRRTIRISLATTVAVAVAYGVAWPLAYITPLFVWNFLKTPQRFGAREAAINIIAPVLGCLLGLLTSVAALHYPIVFFLVTAAVLWTIFYLNSGNLPADVVIWLIIGVTLIPFLALQSQGLTGEIIQGLISSACAAVLIAWLASLVMEVQVQSTVTTSNATPVVSQDQRMRAATISTTIVLPIIVLFYTFNMLDKVLIMIFIAITAQAANLAAGKMIGYALLVSNLMGGIAALFIYNLLQVAPEYLFVLLVTLCTSLMFAYQTFSSRKTAPLFGMAFATTLLLVGSATLPYGGEVDVKFITRILQVMLVALYIVVSLKVVQLVTGE
jgi:hypothetical protein